MTDPYQISSPQNPRIKAAARLRERRARTVEGRYLVDGLREIRRACEAGTPLLEAFYDPASPQVASLVAEFRSRGVECVSVSPRVLEKLAFGERNEGLVAVAQRQTRRLEDLALPGEPLLIVVEAVEKPGNLGAVLRTADAVGAQAVIVADPETDLENPNVIRSSLGTIFHLPTVSASAAEALAWLRRERFRVLAARVDAERLYWEADLRGRLALVLGSEAEGLTDCWRGSDVPAVRLPMHGRADSLNLSVTAAVLCYEALRQRSQGSSAAREMNRR